MKNNSNNGSDNLKDSQENIENQELKEASSNPVAELHSDDATQRNSSFEKTPKPYRIREFNEVSRTAKLLPPATKLYGNIIYEGEITILAGDTGVGKSLLAVNIAMTVASGDKGVTPLQNDTNGKKTLYIDLELSDVQFYKRFPLENYSKNLKRVDTNPTCTGCSIQLNDIINLVNEEKPDFIILDNLTAFMMNSTKDAEIAINVMREFKNLQQTKGITALIMCHIPKRYENTPLTIDNVAGSKHLVNFADSVVFISKSIKDQSIRYLKHVKGRNEELENDVFEMQLLKEEQGLKFSFKEMNSEFEHLASKSMIESSINRKEDAKRLLAEGKSQTHIASMFGVNKSTISRLLK